MSMTPTVVAETDKFTSIIFKHITFTFKNYCFICFHNNHFLTVTIFYLLQKPILLHGHERSITCIKYNREGDLIFSSAKDNQPNVWYSLNGGNMVKKSCDQFHDVLYKSRS
jgi:WD40 repeat protein